MKKVKKKSNAGRKPIEDKKEEVKLFVNKSKIDKLGGKEEVRQVSYKAIDKEIEEQEKDKKKP